MAEREELCQLKSSSELGLIEQTDSVMQAVTQVRTPDELQNIYKELLKLKTLVQRSFEQLASRVDSGQSPDSARKNAPLGSAQKRVSFPAVLAQTMQSPPMAHKQLSTSSATKPLLKK